MSTTKKAKSPAKKCGVVERSPEELEEAKRIAEENALRAKEAHRKVVDTIVSLIDTVGDAELVEKLHHLDVGSWDEVVEERYLARSCGYPTCFEKVTVSNFMGKKYWIQKREKKIYTAIPKSEKFCSGFCLAKSNHIQMQLHDEPLWLSLDRKQKEYQLELPQNPSSAPKSIDVMFSTDADRLLITRLNELKIAENAQSGSESEGEDEDEEKAKKRVEDAEFVNEIRSFVSSVSNMSRQKQANVAGAGKVTTDINNPKADEMIAKNKEKDENVSKSGKTRDKIQVNKDKVIKTSTRLEKLIQDFAEADNVAKQKSKAESPKPVEKPSQSSPVSKAKPKKKPKPSEEPMSPEVEEKLAKLRAKFGKKPEVALRKPPIMIDAPEMKKDAAAKLPEDCLMSEVSFFVHRCIIITVTMAVATVAACTVLVLFGRPFLSDQVVQVAPWMEYSALYVATSLAAMFSICLIGSVVVYMFYSPIRHDDDQNGLVKKNN
ncbi:unnamed protein product [Bursaphelenchus okinawaensis]|uniref:RNA polymerase II subunit B1 CTD phosphatase RPAP2 homolog n=1 Tax=Bursaphelenchus okinawaensis TaxID=465554 RepID=A0A811LNG0_9BILA|nr:unnamed protein product [Bursaphelenchus okinawaensis]CAG9124764.1 unnamed protein product [Bursaphelenchus okinawaensis]